MLNIIDLFSGCGGLTEGFKESNKYKLIAALDWEIDAVKTLRKRLLDRWKVQNADEIVLHFDIQRIEDLLNGYIDDPTYGSSVGLKSLVNKQSIDAVIGGPPCQAYSIAGRISDKHNMQNDYRNYLFESYLEVIKFFKPKACVFENVTGMLSAKPGGISIVSRIKKAFEMAGYVISDDIAKETVFDLSKFSVPQKRKRVIIAAFSKESFSDPKQKLHEFYQTLNSYQNSRLKTVGETILDLPPLYPLIEPEKRRSHTSTDYLKSNKLDHVPRYHNSRDIKIFKLLTNDIKTEQFNYTSVKALQNLYTEMTGRRSSVHKYHVLRENEPSNTIPAHLSKDGLRHIHPDPEQARSITVREAARLQSFPDDFTFYGSSGSKYKMIGNAVPPQFSLYIANALASVITNQA